MHALLALGACTQSSESQIEEVRFLQLQSQMEESIPILIELIEGGNRQGEILYRYGRALSLTGKAERSVWALDAAREDPDWFVLASQQLAIDAHHGGNFEFAMAVFKRLHEEAPGEGDDDLVGLLLEARVLVDSQDHSEEALELLDSILERFPDEETAVRMKAVVLLALKRTDDAYELLRSSGIAPAAGGKDAGEEIAADASGADSAESEEDSGLYLEFEDDAREAYWCALRVSFKREAGEIDEATKIVDDCLEKIPNAVGLITEAVKLYSELGREDRVLAILEKAYEKSPNESQLRGALVQYLGRLGRTKEVEKVLRKTIDEAVAEGRGAALETASYWVELAGFLLEEGRVGEALLAFDSANTILGDSGSPDLLLREAEALIRAKEFDLALEMAKKTPIEVHGLMLRGRIAYEQGKFQEALDILGQAALQWPDNAPIRYYRARAAEGVGDFNLAIEEYRQAVRSDAALDAARERLSKLHLAEGNFREASGIILFQSPRRPSSPSTAMRIMMVEVEARRGTEPDLNIPPDRQHSVERIRKETIQALWRGINARTNSKVAAGVLAELEKGSIPEIRGAFLRERVAAMLSLGDIEGAVREARAGFEARPTDLDTKFGLARALVAQGSSLDEAALLLGEFLAARPDDVDALTAMGDLEVARRDLKRADEAYERALGIAPDLWSAFSPRIAHLFEAGKREEAIRRLESFVAIDAPYDGRGALELALRLPPDESSRERRIRLAKQAIRFGAGKEAVNLLSELDPAAAARFLPPESDSPSDSEKPAAAAADQARKAEAEPASAKADS